MSGYIGSIPVPQATQTRQSFTAVAGQTTFATAGYAPGFVDVFMNGIHILDGVDFQATNGSDILLTAGASAGDVIEVVAYSTYQVNDQAFTGDFSVDTNTLYVDSTNNRVGVGTDAPDFDLTVRRDVAGAAVLHVKNMDTDAGSASILQLQSQSTYVNQVVTGGSTYFQIHAGGGIDKHYSDFDYHLWRTNSGTEMMRLQADGTFCLGSQSGYGGLLSVNRPQTGGSADLLTLRDASSGITFDFNTYSHPSYSNVNHINFSGTYLAMRYGTIEVMKFWNTGQATMGNGYGNSSKLTIQRDNPSGYNSSQLELLSNAGDVVLGLHAGGATAVCLDHVRGSNSIRAVNLGRTSHIPFEASAFNINSDYRVKENITDLTGAIERLQQIPVHRFNFIKGSMMYRDGATVDGFIAHEVQAVVPEAVTGDKDAMRMETYEVTPEERDADGNIVVEAVYGEREVPDLQSIDQAKLVPLLTAALQEALTEIADLKARVTALEAV